MSYLMWAGMWAGGFVCGIVAVMAMARYSQTTDVEIEQADAHERATWPVERWR